MCTPDDGATMSPHDGSSILRIESQNGPVALMTPFALMWNSSPVRQSRTCAPVILDAASFFSEVTSMWFAATAPCWMAVSTSATFMRVSFCWPS